MTLRQKIDIQGTCNIPGVLGSVQIAFAWQKEVGTGDPAPPWDCIFSFLGLAIKFEKIQSQIQAPGMAQLCLETIQIVRPFRGEVCKGEGGVKERFWVDEMLTMIRVMPG